MYGKIVNGKLELAPNDLIKEDGTVIFDYYNNKYNCLADGYKEVINEKPIFNVDTQTVKFKGYNEANTKIYFVYEVISLDEAYLKNEQLNQAVIMYAQTLPDEVAMALPLVYPEWTHPHHYVVGEKCRFDGVLFKCLQDHDSQKEWNPAAAPSIFAKLLNETEDGSIPEWEQPDSTNAYMIGDKVMFNGVCYESVIDNNVWSPETNPAGWVLVKE